MAFSIGANACKLTFRGIQYVELMDSADFTTGENPTTSRKYIVEWDKAYDLAEALVGYISASGGAQRWVAPHADPERPFLFAQTVNASGIGLPGNSGLGGAISYDYAVLDVSYELMPEGNQGPGAGQNSITFLTERYEASAQAITLPKKEYKWESGVNSGQAVGDIPSLLAIRPALYVIIDIHWWFNAPNILTMAELFGTVNSSTFNILGTAYTKGTLRFDATSRQRQWTTNGLQAWQVTHKFTWSKYEWNKKFDPEADDFIFISTDKGRRIHEEEAFGVLFPR